jgi:NAD-dependent dihydropyrimidine dehydrogenase PreA subunit
MAKPIHPTFHPDPEQMALMPERSGNDINGRGETEFRRPTRIYWHNPDAIPHGKIQEWMVNRFNAVEAFDSVYAKGDRGPRELNPVAQYQEQDSPQNWSARIKEFALQHEADLVGIAKLDPKWTYEDCEPSGMPWGMVLGVAMDHARLAQAPSSDVDTVSALEVAVQYNRAARVSAHLANWIRDRGHQSKPHGGPWAGPMTLVPAALSCGFGELGKHGSIINKEYGSSFRLSAVVTDMPLVADEESEFAADEFCIRCQVCINECPVSAIENDKQLVRGFEKWYVNFDKCIPYFNETHGCGICIAVCPWSRPGTAPRLAEKMLRRRERLEKQ